MHTCASLGEILPKLPRLHICNSNYQDQISPFGTNYVVMKINFYFQEERFVLKHMERQEPQGEENGDPSIALNSSVNLHIAQLEAKHLGNVRPRPPLTALGMYTTYSDDFLDIQCCQLCLLTSKPCRIGQAGNTADNVTSKKAL